MKVTRLIREYVERTVRESFKETQEEIDYKILQDKCEKATAYIRTRTDELASMLRQEVIERFDIPEELFGSNASYLAHCSRIHMTETSKKADVAKLRREAAIRNKIDEILLNLELGATKAELDAMIVKLQQESVEN